MIKTKILLIAILLFAISLTSFKFTHSNFSDSEAVLGNSIQIGTWGTTYPETPTEIPIATPTEEAVPTPTPTSEPSIIPWINEIHYDNVGTDTNEFIEIGGPANTDLTGWRVVLYNGNGGTFYDTISLSGIIPDQQGGFGTLWFPAPNLQNGSPDGIALINPMDTVIQFLSYEGVFTATNGLVSGILSVDIGNSETGDEAVGQSLQLTGSGHKYSDFTWAEPSIETKGLINTNQTFN